MCSNLTIGQRAFDMAKTLLRSLFLYNRLATLLYRELVRASTSLWVKEGGGGGEEVGEMLEEEEGNKGGHSFRSCLISRSSTMERRGGGK